MTIELVPFAVVIKWRGCLMAAGIPLSLLFPGVVRWLEKGVQDL